MAAQMVDKGHPALQTLPAERFGKLLYDCNNPKRPGTALLRMVANGKKSLQSD